MATKQTLEELVAIYRPKSNSDLCRVYVEGNTDKHLITWFLKQHGYLAGKHFDIFEGSDINLSGEELKQRDLLDNNRSRVIAVALEIQKQFKVMPKYLSCLVDKDSDWLFGKEYPPCEGLLFSDYCDLEMYLFNEAVIDKFLHLVLSTSAIPATRVLDNLSPVLEELFLIRATSHQALQWGMKWLDKPFDWFDKRFKDKKDNIIQFKKGDKEDFVADFIKRYLDKNNKWSDKSRFDAKLAELRLSSSSLLDRRHKIRGHDFTNMLHWYIKRPLKIDTGDIMQAESVDTGDVMEEESKAMPKTIEGSLSGCKAIEGSLLGCVELKQLKQEKLFKQLLARMPPLTKDV